MENSTLKHWKVKKKFIIYKEDSKGLIKINHVISELPFFHSTSSFTCSISLRRGRSLPLYSFYFLAFHLQDGNALLLLGFRFSTDMKLYDYIELKAKSIVRKIGSLFRASVILV